MERARFDELIPKFEAFLSKENVTHEEGVKMMAYFISHALWHQDIKTCNKNFTGFMKMFSDYFTAIQENINATKNDNKDPIRG
jgi:hypothetical protein